VSRAGLLPALAAWASAVSIAHRLEPPGIGNGTGQRPRRAGELPAPPPPPADGSSPHSDRRDHPNRSPTARNPRH